MSEDKRKVSTDALETLGNIIGETEKRDAIHLAVVPTIAKELLCPGDHLDSRGNKVLMYSDKAVGIVDPFLKSNVNVGERFWLIIYPRQIHSLRHVWTHPAFNDEDSQYEISKKWIENYADRIVKDYNVIEEYGLYDKRYDIEKSKYDLLMDAASRYIQSGIMLDLFALGNYDDPEFEMEFWNHYEIVTGTKIEDEKKNNFFSCCC